MTSNGQTIIHVCFGDGAARNFYFGSISAVYDMFTPEELGVSLNRLWQYGITPEHPYKNKKVIIYKGELHRRKGNRKLPTL